MWAGAGCGCLLPARVAGAGGGARSLAPELEVRDRQVAPRGESQRHKSKRHARYARHACRMCDCEGARGNPGIAVFTDSTRVCPLLP